jgi:hypothetical protein
MMISIPQRFEHYTAKAEEEHVLDGFFGREVVNAENLVFGQIGMNSAIC